MSTLLALDRIVDCRDRQATPRNPGARDLAHLRDAFSLASGSVSSSMPKQGGDVHDVMISALRLLAHSLERLGSWDSAR